VGCGGGGGFWWGGSTFTMSNSGYCMIEFLSCFVGPLPLFGVGALGLYLPFAHYPSGHNRCSPTFFSGVGLGRGSTGWHGDLKLVIVFLFFTFYISDGRGANLYSFFWFYHVGDIGGSWGFGWGQHPWPHGEDRTYCGVPTHRDPVYERVVGLCVGFVGGRHFLPFA